MANATDDKIIRAATELFAARGYAAVGTKDIARRAGVNESTLFRVFGGKRQVFDAVMRSLYQTLIPAEEVKRMMAAPDFEQAMREFADRLTRLYTQNYIRITVAVVIELKRPSAHVRNVSSPIYAPVLRRIAREMRAGTLRKMPPGRALRGLAFMIYAHAFTSALFGSEYRKLMAMRDDETGDYVDIWLNGLKPNSNASADLQ
ncbi:MAG TPA: helix-turn-helix domain-containing protein [Noviherbaspirillum sp.]